MERDTLWGNLAMEHESIEDVLPDILWLTQPMANN